FRIVVADSRAPRDGRFVALLGHYNPRTNPADIKVDAERARAWLEKGALPTDTVRSLLKKAGVLGQRPAWSGGCASRTGNGARGRWCPSSRIRAPCSRPRPGCSSSPRSAAWWRARGPSRHGGRLAVWGRRGDGAQARAVLRGGGGPAGGAAHRAVGGARASRHTPGRGPVFGRDGADAAVRALQRRGPACGGRSRRGRT